MGRFGKSAAADNLGMQCRNHPLRSSQDKRCHASTVNHSMITYIAGYASKDARMQCKQDKNGNDALPCPPLSPPVPGTPPLSSSSDTQSTPPSPPNLGSMRNGTVEMRHSELKEFECALGLATQSSLCIERGLLLRRAMNQLKANKVALCAWDWVWDWDSQWPCRIDCSLHLTYVCCRRKMLILESRGTAM